VHNSPKGKVLFSFGIITDTHVRAPQGDRSSPYPVNDLANERARYAVNLLTAQQPEFVIHLGDMVHPLPSMPAYDDACIEALEIFEPLREKLYFVSGNHDTGDKPMPGSPAAVVDDNALSAYQKHFGKSWHYFTHQDCQIIVINSSLINTGTSSEKHQFKWLTDTLKSNRNKRKIVFSHYPLFLHDVDEPEHYDNIAEPGRAELLALLNEFNVELVFSGHVHQFFYNNLSDSHYYVLPPTSFTRQDYAEMFNVSPAPEFGRDDVGKYSVAMVHILEDGHYLQLIPTNGISQSKAASDAPATISKSTIPSDSSLTVSLRHAWHSSIDLPYNGPMEEFSRKRVRNDYGLLRLLQMGISNARVPLQDLLEESSRLRMQEYRKLGIRFHVYCMVNQLAGAVSSIERYSDLVESIEIVLPSDSEHWKLEGVDTSRLTMPIVLGYAATGAHKANDSKPFAHTVSSGFLWDTHKQDIERIRAASANISIDSVVFQIPWENNLTATLTEMDSAFDSLPWRCQVNLRLSNSNPAIANFDDTAIASRINTALSFVTTSRNIDLTLDTFMDVDRGYSPRHGLIDRHANFRAAGLSLIDS